MARNRTFKFLSWNVRGLNNKDKCSAVNSFIRSCKCAAICLQETKLPSLSPTKFRSFCGSHISEFRALDAVGSRGGLVTAWNPALFVCDAHWVGSFSLTTELRRKVDGLVFTLSNVYGPIDSALKGAFLQEIRDNGLKAVGVWALLGDFNMLLSLADKNGPSVRTSEMLSFRDTIGSLALFDVPLSNRAFTWSNGRPNPTLLDSTGLLSRRASIFSSPVPPFGPCLGRRPITRPSYCLLSPLCRRPICSDLRLFGCDIRKLGRL